MLENRLHLCHWFTVDDLYHLKRGGRVFGGNGGVGQSASDQAVRMWTKRAFDQHDQSQGPQGFPARTGGSHGTNGDRSGAADGFISLATANGANYVADWCVSAWA